MVRNRKKNIGHSRRKKSLYEVIGEGRLKSRYSKSLEQPHPEKTDRDKPTTEPSMAVPERATQWPRKPRIVQFNAGRIEISIPYQLAIVFLLGIILVVLVVFRLGEWAAKKQENNLDTPPARKEPAGRGQNTDTDEKMLVNGEKTELAEPKGNNRIVIQEYQVRAHLEPVQQYFAQFDIETEIRKIGGTYYLVTRKKYENPGRAGTDGYLAKQKIIEFGAQYKAPQGYETFAPHFFKDAYGMKFDD